MPPDELELPLDELLVELPPLLDDELELELELELDDEEEPPPQLANSAASSVMPNSERATRRAAPGPAGLPELRMSSAIARSPTPIQ